MTPNGLTVYTVKEAAEILKTTRQQIRKMITTTFNKPQPVQTDRLWFSWSFSANKPPVQLVVNKNILK